MSVAVEVKVSDAAAPAIQKAIQAMQPGALQKRVGPACAGVTRSWLRGRPSNKRGWPTTNFYQRASKATTWSATEDGVVISINQIGIRQRYHGGPIRPVTAKALTIPISSQAYGKRASDFPGAFMIKTPKGSYIVQYSGGNTPKGRFKKQAATLEFLFKLSLGVNQKPDPTVLPADDVYYTTAHQAIKEGLNR